MGINLGTSLLKCYKLNLKIIHFNLRPFALK